MGTSPGLTADVAFIHCLFPGTAVIQEEDKLQHLIIISAKPTWNNASEIKGYRKGGKWWMCFQYFFLLFFEDKIFSSLQFRWSENKSDSSQSYWTLRVSAVILLGCAEQTLNRSPPRLITGTGLGLQKTFYLCLSPQLHIRERLTRSGVQQLQPIKCI